MKNSLDTHLDIGIDIPVSYITQKGAILGITGSGKSYAAGNFIEEFLEYNIPFVLFDVMGIHYGLASKHRINLVGGDKGNTLLYTEGKAWAEHTAKTNTSIVFDLSHFNDDEIQIFVAAYLTELFNQHKSTRAVRHIFMEEAEVVFPQVHHDESRESLAAGNRIMKRGRGLGLGMTLISQRPQDINKKVLSQTQCAFILHLEGIQELAVLDKMVKSHPDRKKIIERVLHFKQGECLLYSPSWLGRVEYFKFRERRTFHAGYTPELGKTVIEPPLNITKPVLVQEAPKEEAKDLTLGKIMPYMLVILITGTIAILI